MMNNDQTLAEDFANMDLSKIAVENTLMGSIYQEERVFLARLSRVVEGEEIEAIMTLEGAFLTVRETAELLTVAQATVRHLIRQGKLEKRQIGQEIRITWESVVAFIDLERREIS